MDTPPPPAPAPAAPSPKVEKWNRIARKANKVIAVIAILVVIMIYFGRKIIMGTKYKVSDKESVNYSGKATEEEAKHLGDLLKKLGVLTGERNADVLLLKNEKEGTVVSFVVNSTEDKIVEAFRSIGEAVSTDGFGKPLTVRLLDDHLNTRKEIKIE